MTTIMQKQLEVNRIFIYGAGVISDIAYYFLDNEGFGGKIAGFIVTKLDGNVKSKFGKPIVELLSVKEQLDDAVIYIAVNEHVVDEIESTLKKQAIDNYVVLHSEDLLDRFYSQLNRKDIVDNKIVFQNAQGEGYGCNPKYIAEALHSISSSLDLVWAVSDLTKKFPDYIRKVEYGSAEYYEELATAKIWIDNCRKPISIRKRPGQFYIQAWHGAAPGKKVEADASASLPSFYVRTAQNDSAMADLFLSGSDFYTNLYKKSFWYAGDILKVGLPRQDIFFRDNSAIKKKIYDQYKIKSLNKVVLYAPTFRSYPAIDCYDLDVERVKINLEKRFGTEFTLLVSRHPVNYQEYEFPVNSDYISVKNYDDFQELLAVADVLISDYSGCIYDYAFSGRPIFLYQKDYDLYLKDRDFYIPMENTPYITAKDNDQLEEEILSFDYDKYLTELNAFMQSMGNYDDGSASIQVAKYIIENVLTSNDTDKT